MKSLKKLLLLFVCALLIGAIFEKEAFAVEEKKLKINGRCAIAIDKETGQILFEQNGFEIVEMASTTKILTALIALENADLNEEFTVSKRAATCRGSEVGYKEGDKIKVKELLFGLMYKSGNDAAITLAEGIGGTEEEFARIMNHYSSSLGLIDSHFQTPHGLDKEDHYSSAYDLAILTSKAMDYKYFREIVGTKSISKEKYGFTRDYNNINKILWKIEGANGVKTGYTGKAGKCLVSSVNKNGKDIIIVVLNCPNRWEETKKIYDDVQGKYAFKRSTMKELTKHNGKEALSALIEDEEVAFAYNPGKTKEEIDVYNRELDIEKGDIIAAYKIMDNTSKPIKYPIKSSKNIKREEFQNVLSFDK